MAGRRSSDWSQKPYVSTVSMSTSSTVPAPRPASNSSSHTGLASSREVQFL